MENVLYIIKKGFISGIKSYFNIEPPKPVSQQEVNRRLEAHWKAVGGYLRVAMDEVEQSEEYQEALRRNDTQRRVHEPEKEDLETA